jgi:serine protease Do
MENKFNGAGQYNIITTVLISIVCSSITALVMYHLSEKGIVNEYVYQNQAPVRFANHNLNTRPRFHPEITNVSSFTEAAKRARPCVVHIKTISKSDSETNFDMSASTGSGVIISGDGYILTNNHVVESAKEVRITLNDKRIFNAKVIGTDPSTDLAVIKIKEKELKSAQLPAFKYANSDLIDVGQWVLAVGNPFNLTSTVTAGIVSAKGRNIDILEGTYSVESFIQTDAVVNPGNSGGALVDTEGNLVGINTAIITRSGRYEGYSFAIPINLARKVANDIIEFGSVQRGFLGITIRDVSNEQAEQLGLGAPKGVYIDRLNAGGAAENAGIKKGDVILTVNGQEVNSSPELQEQVAMFRPGQKVKITYFRDGKVYELDISLKDSGNIVDSQISKKNQKFDNKESLLSDLGIELKVLSDAELKKNKIKTGIMVMSIKPGSVIHKTNMEKGFIILSVNRKPIKTLDDFFNAVLEAEDEVVLEGFYESYSGDYTYMFKK